MNKINKTFESEIKQVGEEQDRVLRFITSTESEDRDGDIIEIDGWKLDNYMKNPVILYGHNYEGLPVGKSISIQKDSVNKKLIQDVKFPTRDEYEFADTVYRLAKAGYLNATSVGFIGLQVEPRLNEKGEYLGKRYKKQELLETSIVPVPSNPTALMEARSKGIINEKELKDLSNNIKDFELDTDNNLLKINDNGEIKTIAFDFLKSLDDEYVKEYGEWKSGAALSTKNTAMLNEICETMKACGDRLRKFIDTSGTMEDEPPEKSNEISEVKEALEEIKSQVLLLCQKLEQKDATKVEIDLDAIEFSKAEKDAAHNELEIKPEELKEIVRQIINEQIEGGK